MAFLTAVELIETVEQTGKIYAYGENYCYMPAPYEMRKLYKQGKLVDTDNTTNILGSSLLNSGWYLLDPNNTVKFNFKNI